jgi:hypothetical protein
MEDQGVDQGVYAAPAPSLVQSVVPQGTGSVSATTARRHHGQGARPVWRLGRLHAEQPLLPRRTRRWSFSPGHTTEHARGAASYSPPV